MTHHPTSSPLRCIIGAAVGVLLLAIGLSIDAAPVAAAVVPVNGDGCPTSPQNGPALPCSTFELGCPKFGLDVRLANAAAATANAEFTITTPTTTVTASVAPNDTVWRSVHIGEDQTVHIKVEETTTGQVFVDGDFTRDCTNPSGAVADLKCATGIDVTVANAGGRLGTTPVDFRIDAYDNGANAPTRTFTVSNVTTAQTQVVPPVAEGPIRIVVTALIPEGAGNPATEKVVADRTQPVDCQEPTVTISHACATGGLDVTVTAPAGQDETAFTIVIKNGSGATVLTQDITVQPGSSTKVTLANAAEGTTYTATVTETGQQTVLATDTVTVHYIPDLPPPPPPANATVQLACATGGGVVATVTNGTGSSATNFDVTFTSNVGVATVANQAIPAGTSKAIPFASPGEGQVISVKVVQTGTTTQLAQASLTVDCANPTVTVTHACADGGVLVTVTAPAGQDESSFTVVIRSQDGTPVVNQTITVPAGQNGSVTLPNPTEGATYTVTVTETGSTTTVGSGSILVDCQHPAPAAAAAHACATGVTVTVTTADAEAASTAFHVVVSNQDGSVALERDLTVAGAGSTGVTLSNPIDGQSTRVVVTSGGATLLDTSLAVACAEVENTGATQGGGTEVLGTQTRRPSTLPTTGPTGVGPLGTEQLFAVALGLILAGSGLAGLAGDRLRRPARVDWR